MPWAEIEPWREGKRCYEEATRERLRMGYETTRQGGWNRWVEIAPDFMTFAELVGL